MKNNITAIILSILLSAILLSACSAAESSADSIEDNSTTSIIETFESSSDKATSDVSETDLEIVSANLCKDMVQGDFALTYALFSDNMRKAATEEQVAVAWQQTIVPLGGYLRYDGCTLSYVNGFAVADSRLEFENGPLSVQITYSDGGIIEGLYFLYPEQ